MLFFPALASFALSLSASIALLLLLMVIAFAGSWWVYRQTVPEISRSRRNILLVLRGTALSLILFLLFEPVLNLQRSETLQPRVAVLIDDSRSMTVEDDGVARSDMLRRFVESREYARLAGDGRKSEYLFAGKLFPMQSITADSLMFDGAETDIARALQQAWDDNVGKNLAAVVLVTDGVFTSGKNPLYTAEALGVPVHVVAVGDSSEKKDILVSRVLANNIAYVESSIPVDVTIRSAGFDEGRTMVSLSEGTTVLESHPVDVRPGVNEYPVSFSYEPGDEGVKKLTVRAEPLPGELTVKNNSSTFFVKVLSSRMKVMILASAPSPDVSFVQRELRKDRNIETMLYVQKAAGGWYEKQPTREDIMASDCIILVGFPSGGADMGLVRMLAQAADKEGVPLMILPARNTDFRVLKQGLDVLLPFEIVQSRQDETEVMFEPTPSAAVNPVLSTGIPSDVWRRLPPLFKTESSFKVLPGAEVLATMNLNGISFNEPLLVQRRINRSKILAWTGYGLWRWQLAHDVLDGNVPGALFSNAVRWLTTRDDDKRIRVRPSKEFFDSGESVEFLGQVYNESYEPLENAAVSVVVRADDEERELVLSPMGAGRYIGMVELSGEGDYEYFATATLDGRELGKDNGRFSVGELNIEFHDTRMNNILLRQIASRTGGSYVSVADPAGLTDAIQASPLFHPAQRAIKSDIQLWNLVWLLSLAVLLFATEWYLRKQSGLV